MSRFNLLFLFLFMFGCSPSESPGVGSDSDTATAANGWDKGGMATAANPHAVAAAIEMLEKGGHAVDVNPQAQTEHGVSENLDITDRVPPDDPAVSCK